MKVKDALVAFSHLVNDGKGECEVYQLRAVNYHPARNVVYLQAPLIALKKQPAIENLFIKTPIEKPVKKVKKAAKKKGKK